MNYRHAFHAGNFADVVKHATLGRIVAHLKEKPGAFRVIDTHAGAGLYDLTGAEASRTGEWRAGIGRLRAASLEPAVRDLLAPYLEAVAALNPDKLTTYPGSPTLTRAWLRPQDRLVACELEPKAADALASAMHGDARVKVVAIDGSVVPLSAFARVTQTSEPTEIIHEGQFPWLGVRVGGPLDELEAVLATLPIPPEMHRELRAPD